MLVCSGAHTAARTTAKLKPSPDEVVRMPVKPSGDWPYAVPGETACNSTSRAACWMQSDSCAQVLMHTSIPLSPCAGAKQNRAGRVFQQHPLQLAYVLVSFLCAFPYPGKSMLLHCKSDNCYNVATQRDIPRCSCTIPRLPYPAVIPTSDGNECSVCCRQRGHCNRGVAMWLRLGMPVN